MDNNSTTSGRILWWIFIPIFVAIIGGVIVAIIVGEGRFRSTTIGPEGEGFCAFLTNSQIDQLRNINPVSAAIDQAEVFATHRQNDYDQGDMIPSGVVIATDLRNADISVFPVSAINREGGWGLFLTKQAFIAPNDGTYWCIR